MIPSRSSGHKSAQRKSRQPQETPPARPSGSQQASSSSAAPMPKRRGKKKSTHVDAAPAPVVVATAADDWGVDVPSPPETSPTRPSEPLAHPSSSSAPARNRRCKKKNARDPAVVVATEVASAAQDRRPAPTLPPPVRGHRGRGGQAASTRGRPSTPLFTPPPPPPRRPPSLNLNLNPGTDTRTTKIERDAAGGALIEFLHNGALVQPRSPEHAARFVVAANGPDRLDRGGARGRWQFDGARGRWRFGPRDAAPSAAERPPADTLTQMQAQAGQADALAGPSPTALAPSPPAATSSPARVVHPRVAQLRGLGLGAPPPRRVAVAPEPAPNPASPAPASRRVSPLAVDPILPPSPPVSEPELPSALFPPWRSHPVTVYEPDGSLTTILSGDVRLSTSASRGLQAATDNHNEDAGSPFRPELSAPPAVDEEAPVPLLFRAHDPDSMASASLASLATLAWAAPPGNFERERAARRANKRLVRELQAARANAGVPLPPACDSCASGSPCSSSSSSSSSSSPSSSCNQLSDRPRANHEHTDCVTRPAFFSDVFAELDGPYTEQERESLLLFELLMRERGWLGIFIISPVIATPNGEASCHFCCTLQVVMPSMPRVPIHCERDVVRPTRAEAKAAAAELVFTALSHDQGSPPNADNTLLILESLRDPFSSMSTQWGALTSEHYADWMDSPSPPLVLCAPPEPTEPAPAPSPAASPPPAPQDESCRPSFYVRDATPGITTPIDTAEINWGFLAPPSTPQQIQRSVSDNGPRRPMAELAGSEERVGCGSPSLRCVSG